MFRRIFAAALGAGIAVGLLTAALQHVALVPLILEAERYEKGPGQDHKHARGAPQSIRDAAADIIGTVPDFIARGHAQEAGHGAAGESSPWRAVLTSIATTLTSIGFALLLAGRSRSAAVRSTRAKASCGASRALPLSHWRRRSACRPNCPARSPPISRHGKSGGPARWRPPHSASASWCSVQGHGRFPSRSRCSLRRIWSALRIRERARAQRHPSSRPRSPRDRWWSMHCYGPCSGLLQARSTRASAAQRRMRQALVK
jgi:Probable cobalt transporter subunit (CbtA)